MFKMCQCGLKSDAVTNSKGGISRINRRRNEEKGAQNMLSLKMKGNPIWKKGDQEDVAGPMDGFGGMGGAPSGAIVLVSAGRSERGAVAPDAWMPSSCLPSASLS